MSTAKPPFWRAFVALYNIKPDSVIGKTRCLTCHEPPGPPKRNTYGDAVEAALRAANARFITPDMLKSIEKKDAGDKVPFISKIKHDIPPGQIKPQKRALDLGTGSALLMLSLGATTASWTRRTQGKRQSANQ